MKKQHYPHDVRDGFHLFSARSEVQHLANEATFSEGQDGSVAAPPML